MNLDTGKNAMTRFHANHMASRKGDIRVPDEFLSNQKVQYIIDLINQPKHDDHDLESRNVIYHQTIGLFK